MNRYPLWKYIIIGVALAIGLVYTLPNFFPDVPAVQVSSSKSSVKVDSVLLTTVEDALKAGGVPYSGELLDPTGVKVRFADTDTQLKAKDVLQAKLGDNYIVALNLLSSSPQWLTSIGALPMYLGLDLRGGVHFLLQVDMKGALDKAADRYTTDIRSLMREKRIAYSGVGREQSNVVLRFKDDAERNKARNEIELALSAVQHAVGQPIAPFFRFPYLAYSNSMATHLQNRNIATFSIDIDSKDYRTRDPVAVHRRVLAELARTRKGIILFHDIQPSTAHALPGLLAELQAKGYRIVHMRPKAAVATLTEFDAVAQKAFDRRNVAGTHPLKRVLSWTSTVDEVTPSASTTGALEGVPPDPRPALRLRGMYDEDWKSGLWRTY